MSGEQSAKVAVGMSTGAAVLAALAWLKSGKAIAAEGVIPEELMNLVIALAQSADNVADNTLAIIAAIGKLGQGLGWPANTDSLTSLRVPIAVTGTQLTEIIVPSGMSLLIKAWPLNPGWLRVGASLAECVNVNSAFPLIPSEIVHYYIQNANQIYISATAPGCFASLTVEQNRRGGG